MFHVDNNSAVPVMPAVKPVVSAVTSFFTEGGNGVPPTYPGPDWFNIIQSELLAILAAAGISPDKASNVQLLAAMRALFLDASQNGADIQDKAAFLQNLGLNLFVQLSNQTRMDSPGKTYSLAVMDNDWGVWLTGTGTRVPLSMEAGGTGSGTPAGARQALGLKGAAVLDVGKVAGSVAAGDDSRITGAMQKSALGSDIPDKGAFQNNLGLSFNGTINSFTSKGPGLLIKQGGKVTAPNGTGNSLVIDFPIAFPNGCVDAFAIFEDGVPNQTPFEISIVPENTKMTVYILSTGGTIYFNNRSLRWSAEGF